MAEVSNNVQAVGTINYQFTAIPTNLIYLLDADCLKAFSILVQKETYWRNRNMLNNGCFIKSITELSNELKLKNRKDIHTIIEALYRAKLIKVYVKPQEYKTARFYINWEYINKKYLSYSLGDAIEFLEQIQKLSRNTEITYVTKYVTNNVTKCNTTIDNINNKKEIYNINNIKEIKEDAVEKTASLESTIIIITDSNDELESDTKTNDTMNYKTRINIETLTARMSNSTSKEELEDKNTKFHKWLDTKLDNEELTSTEYTQQIEDINKVYNQTYSKLDNEPTEESETILDEIVSDFFSSNGETKQQNKELECTITIPTTKTKEQIAADLEDFKNSLASYENKEDAISNLKWYGNKWDKEIISNDMLKSYQELLNYVIHGDKEKNDDTTPALTIEDDVKLQLENFKSSMFNYNSQKEAKKEFNNLVCKLDKEIIDFKLEELVKEIYDSINGWGELNQETTSLSQNKALTDTFNSQGGEVHQKQEKTQETALKSPTEEVVIKEDSAEPKLHTTANTGTSVESKALAMSIFYKKPLEQVMLEIEASRAARGGIIVEEEYPF